MKKNNDNLIEELLDKVNKMEGEIAELKRKQSEYQQHYYPPLPVNDFNKCNDDGEHKYPNPWHSISPSHCLKCGKQAPNYRITYGNDSGNFIGGNIMNSNLIPTHDSNQEMKTNYNDNNL